MRCDAVEQIAVRVLHLVVGDEAGFVGGFDAEEDRGEAGVLEELQKFEIVGEIERSFGDEAEGIAVFPAPLDHGGEEFLGALLVADEVVVDDEDGVAPAGVAELVEFGEHLGDGLGAGLAAVDLDDVAEFAVERAAARVLHGHGAVATHLDQAEVGQRADVHGGALGGLVDRHGRSRWLRSLASVAMRASASPMTMWSALSVGCGHAAGDGSADNGAQPARAAAFDDGDEMLVLRMHAADQGDVGPGEVGVGQAFDVGVDEALGPACGQQRGNGHQAERRLGGALALERECVLEAPVGVGKSGIDQQCVHSPMQLSCWGARGAMGIQKDYRGSHNSSAHRVLNGITHSGDSEGAPGSQRVCLTFSQLCLAWSCRPTSTGPSPSSARSPIKSARSGTSAGCCIITSSAVMKPKTTVKKSIVSAVM